MFKTLVRSTFVVLLICLMVAPSDVRAGKHVIDSKGLQNAIDDAAKIRNDNLQQLQDFLKMPEIQNILKKNSVDTDKVYQATAQLSDEELAKLAKQSQQIQKDFAGGFLSNRELMFLVIILAFVIVVIAVAD